MALHNEKEKTDVLSAFNLLNSGFRVHMDSEKEFFVEKKEK